MKEQTLIQMQKEVERLGATVAAVEGVTNTTSKKMMDQHRTLQSILVLLKNYDARVTTLQDLVIENGWVDDRGWEDRIDKILGLRRKGDTEKISVGDVVWVDYTAHEDGEDQEYTERNFPVRVGSKAMIFEDALIGKDVTAKGIEYSGEWDEKKIIFKIDVMKVKRNKKEKEAMDGLATSGTEGGTESPVEAGRSGHEERGDSQPQPVQ